MSTPATSMMNVPLGFEFAPTDRELICSYLLRKAIGLPLSCDDIILDKNLYGENANPWDVLGDDSRWSITSCLATKEVKKDIYVFTKISKKSTRIARMAGCGTWEGQTGVVEKIYSDNGEEIGMIKMFSFRSKKKPVSAEINIDDDNWIMREYSLSGISLSSDELIKHKDYVLCKITRILSRKKFDQEVKEKGLLGRKTSSFDENEEIVQIEEEDDHHQINNNKKQKFTGSN